MSLLNKHLHGITFSFMYYCCKPLFNVKMVMDTLSKDDRRVVYLILTISGVQREELDKIAHI